MSLTTEDLTQIRGIVREEADTIIRTVVRDEVKSVVTEELKPIDQKLDTLAGKIEALENDIKDIYQMLKDLQGAAITDKKFTKMNLEKRVLVLNAEVVNVAKQAGVTLPR